MGKSIDYGKEFDNLVNDYINYKPSFQEGIETLFNISGSLESDFNKLYLLRMDLTGNQKDLIAFAIDIKKVWGDSEMGKQSYENCKRDFVISRMKEAFRMRKDLMRKSGESVTQTSNTT